MRFITVPTYTFMDANGVSKTVREMKEIETFPNVVEITKTDSDWFDEIASRREVYGQGGEASSYKLDEANLIQIYDALLDYSALRKIRVPR